MARELVTLSRKVFLPTRRDRTTAALCGATIEDRADALHGLSKMPAAESFLKRCDVAAPRTRRTRHALCPANVPTGARRAKSRPLCASTDVAPGAQSFRRRRRAHTVFAPPIALGRVSRSQLLHSPACALAIRRFAAHNRPLVAAFAARLPCP